MPIQTRDEIKKIIRGNVAGGLLDSFETEVVPNGQKWQLSSLVFSDQGIGDGKSGGFTLEWGTTGSWDFVEGGYLTGTTWRQEMNRVFIGDGVKRFRIRRQNNSLLPKDMIVVIAGFKRIGG